VAFAVELTGLTASDAIELVLGQMDVGDGGIIAVDAKGVPAMHFTTGGMFRGHLTNANAEPQTFIF